MPAAAVIPAPIAYIKVAAVKKLVVGFLIGAFGSLRLVFGLLFGDQKLELERVPRLSKRDCFTIA